MEHGEPYDLEVGFISAQGQYRWVHTRGFPQFENGRVVRVTGNIVDITESKIAENALREANKQLEERDRANQTLQALLLEQATHDALTHLYNRRFLDDALRRELLRAERKEYPVSLMMLDIDHFKNFNDMHGHEAGDMVLLALGELLLTSIRGSDFACRYGGEEFVVIMPGAGLEDAVARGEAICEAFARQRITVANLALSATISVGVAVYPQHGATSDELLRAADAAMYVAKQAGRNRVRIWRKPPVS